MKRALQWLFGCHHHHLSRVWARIKRSTVRRTYYQTCLDCGAEIPYRGDLVRFGMDIGK